MYYYCTKDKKSLNVFYLEKNGQIQKPISRKRIGVLCVVVIHLHNICFSSSHLMFSHYSHAPSQYNSNSDLGSNSPLPPFPLRHVPSFISRGEVSVISSLIDLLCRISPRHAPRRSQQLVPFFYRIFAIRVKSHHGGNRTQGQTHVSSIRGNQRITAATG